MPGVVGDHPPGPGPQQTSTMQSYDRGRLVQALPFYSPSTSVRRAVISNSMRASR